MSSDTVRDAWGKPMPATCPHCGEPAGRPTAGGDWRCGSFRVGDTTGDEWTVNRGYVCERIVNARAEGERAATERMARDWYEMRDALQSVTDSLESALRRVEFYEVDRPRKPKHHRTVRRARLLLVRTADAIERGEHKEATHE